MRFKLKRSIIRFYFFFFLLFHQLTASPFDAITINLMMLVSFFMQSSRLKKVQEHLYTLNSICSVLGLDFKQTVNAIHPSLGESEGSNSVSNDTIQRLAVAIQELREVKLQRMQKVKTDLEINSVSLCLEFCVLSSG